MFSVFEDKILFLKKLKTKQGAKIAPCFILYLGQD